MAHDPLGPSERRFLREWQERAVAVELGPDGVCVVQNVIAPGQIDTRYARSALLSEYFLYLSALLRSRLDFPCLTLTPELFEQCEAGYPRAIINVNSQSYWGDLVDFVAFWEDVIAQLNGDRRLRLLGSEAAWCAHHFHVNLTLSEVTLRNFDVRVRRPLQLCPLLRLFERR